MARHRYRVQLRWSDMDALRHVNNVQFLRFLEDARVQMMVEAGRRGFESELHVVVVRHEIDYRRPLLFRTEPVVVDTWVTHVGRTSYAVAYEIREEHDDVVYATASTVMVCVDARDGRPQPLDEQLRTALEQFGDDGEIADGDASVAGLVDGVRGGTA
ncbi:MAG: thioesterase family protein [Candidatus Nanopelagicales bacterium]|jgi:acyl-CoA thioester hydrolase